MYKRGRRGGVQKSYTRTDPKSKVDKTPEIAPRFPLSSSNNCVKKLVMFNYCFSASDEISDISAVPSVWR